MSLAAQLEADFLTFDGLEAITFIARRTDAAGDADETEASIDYALPAEVSYRDQSLGVVVDQAVTRIWNIRKTDLDDESITPREGDVIKQADNTEWTIRGMVLRSLSTRYRFFCSQGRD